MEQDRREEAVRRFGEMVWRLALARMASVPDAEDVFQEVFLRYFRHEGKLNSDEHRRAWLIRCTINRTKSALAAPWRHRVLPLDVAADAGVREENREVYAAVLALPPKYRTVVHLHYFEGLSVAEIAAHLGCAEGTVKAQLHRARAQLREALRDVQL
ncbi:MAG: sigma-70 family RNA polymerase sigma factor [Clostridia bacterium]|nr:sigma-70 family RNA polymerase sigma factor [Clostridia bacterium]